MMNISEVLSDTPGVSRFDLSDYAVFFGMLGASTLIGVYFGCFGSKQSTTAEYLLGGKTMKAIPVGLSLVASHISGITLIGVPSEVYTENATYLLMILALFFACIVNSYLFIPVFCNLNITSAYEYLEFRFNKKVRKLASVLYVVRCMLFLPAVVFVPAMSLSQVTGVNLHLISVGVSAVCVFYTMIGGLKAVVWTDFLQTVTTIVACIAIVVIGTVNAGGVSYVLETAAKGGKLDIFNMDPNPFQRTSFWIVIIGIFSSWTAGLTSGQESVQRFMSVPTLHDARIILLTYWIGVSLLTSLSIYGGILMYSAYVGCDPIANKLVSRADQMYPYYVLDKIGYIPLLPGLFVSGVFSAALSSLSAALNTLAGTIYEDYIKRKEVSEKSANHIMKLIVVVIGVFTVLMVLVVEKMGKVLSLSYTLGSITGAPCFILFALGMLFPTANTVGAVTGALSSMLFLVWVAVGASLHQINAVIKPIYPGVPNTCDAGRNMTALATHFNWTSSAVTAESDDIFFLYKLSFLQYMTFGLLVGMPIGVIVSHLTGPTDLKTLDPELISPPIRRFLPKRSHEAKQVEMKLINENNQLNNVT